MQGNSFQLLNTGNKSEVFLYKNSVVLKMVDVRHTNQIKHLKNQYEHMSGYDHPNILKVLELKHNIPFSLTPECKSDCKRDVMVMRYVREGCLLSALEKGLEGRHRKMIAAQITSALEYLHLKKQTAHRDLKLENILVQKEADGTVTAFLSDFGFAIKKPKVVPQVTNVEGSNTQGQVEGNLDQNSLRIGTEKVQEVVESQPFLTNSYKGTKRGYMAPEVYRNQGKRVGYNPFKADIFSLGVVLFSLFFGKLPFEYACPRDLNFKLIIQKRMNQFWAKQEINELKYSNINLEELKTLLGGMFCHVPENRYTVSDVMESEFIRNLSHSNRDSQDTSEEEEEEDSSDEASASASTHSQITKFD